MKLQNEKIPHKKNSRKTPNNITRTLLQYNNCSWFNKSSHEFRLGKSQPSTITICCNPNCYKKYHSGEWINCILKSMKCRRTDKLHSGKYIWFIVYLQYLIYFSSVSDVGPGSWLNVCNERAIMTKLLDVESCKKPCIYGHATKSWAYNKL